MPSLTASVLLVVWCLASGSVLYAGDVTVTVDSPMPPPDWAVLERELLRANEAACREFFDRYFDERGYLLCVERWGGDDGPDDAIENCLHWPILHALGADDSILGMYKKAWEGHLRQFTEAKTVEVPFARHGMYYKEFPVMFDWLHHSEGLTVFNLQGLSDPDDVKFGHRVRRYAGFYMNEDPQAPNYDPDKRIIRSMFNGSRGPLLRKATALDWTGDPIEVEGRFDPRHGERNYQEMLAHFKDYNDIVGDHPQNLKATSLALNAYMLTGEEKYKRWLLEYVDAWLQRMHENDGIIPSNVGLDGKIGSAAGGKWYGGVYGWGFSVVVPQTGDLAHRNNVHLGLAGFLNAYLLTGEDRYLDGWRKQLDAVNSNSKTVEGRTLYPHMYGRIPPRSPAISKSRAAERADSPAAARLPGSSRAATPSEKGDEGWYLYTPQPYNQGALEIYYLTMNPEDRKWLRENAWLAYLDGENPAYPERALRRDFSRLRQRVEGMRNDTTTPDTRLADDPMRFNPASVRSLVELMNGGLYPNKQGMIYHCRLRYFDPARRRAGIPEDVAALVDTMTNDTVALTLVNVDQVEPRTLVVQGGAYGEHEFLSAEFNGQTVPIGDSAFNVRLAPGAGSRLVLRMRRYVNQPALAFPWNR